MDEFRREFIKPSRPAPRQRRLTFQQQDVILLVLWSFRILPIEIQPVEPSVPQERNSAVDERLSRVPRPSHVLEFLRAEGPPSNGQQRLQARIGLLQLLDPLVQPRLAVFGLVVALERRQLALLQPAESEDDVGAEVGDDVFGGEFANLDSILGPVGVVAHHFVAIFVLLGTGGERVVGLAVARSGPQSESVHAGGHILVLGDWHALRDGLERPPEAASSG